VEPNGNVTQLSELSKPTNGVAGYNASSIHISYIGGVDANNKPIDNRTEFQKQSLFEYVKRFKLQFKNAKVQGHKDFPSVKKACPCFDAKAEYLNI
jgi:N-acetylmuramoyl-L-alanine amidase